MIEGFGWTVALAFLVIAGVALWAMPLHPPADKDEEEDEHTS